MTTLYQDRIITAPVPTPENQPYYDAAERGELLIKRCLACAAYHFHPRTICPHCFSDQTQWVVAQGVGTIYTFSVSRRVLPTAYAIAYVNFEKEEEASLAIEKLSGFNFEGRILQVEIYNKS